MQARALRIFTEPWPTRKDPAFSTRTQGELDAGSTK